ncbi:unnamed protein product [Rotaria sp. Silwood1]|nr:unnamed protein product [Rotaria sp. Silwood1]CAF4768472.1 unnamed protein product [Rotaria sp. Silwood1]
MDFQFHPVTNEDEELYKQHSQGIEQKVREVFPSIPSSFVLKPVTLRKMNACAMIYDFMIGLPDGTFAKVTFSVGGFPSGPSAVEEEQIYRVDETSYPSSYPTR